MNFLFDANMPPSLAAAIACLGADRFEPGHIDKVVHLTELFPADTQDITWLTTLGQDRGARWTIISRDGFRKQKGAERQVLRQYGLSVFVLQKSWASRQYWELSAQFVHWWPRIVAQACATEKAAMEVPWSISGRFQQI
ncbi:hypothetical protein [Delftia tsuruhatensis]|uniref:PIN-like domain-containing protein n=1 Tax=Delftia tsuruhatensis TaxID=180282 RepID=UPI001F210E6B|nr:hypothetical protein [Delftia tsuruhatensis]